MILVYETLAANLTLLALFIASYALFERSEKWSARLMFLACVLSLGFIGLFGVTVAVMIFTGVLS